MTKLSTLGIFVSDSLRNADGSLKVSPSLNAVMPDELDGFESLASVMSRDERWSFLGNRTLEQHHTDIAQYALHEGVPLAVRQQYENARNTWLYAFFSYRLLQVALMQVHVAGEAAIKERARREGINLRSKQANTLEKLLDMAVARRWLLDEHFTVVADTSSSDSAGEQGYVRRLADAFRHIRNSLAHGEVLLDPSLGWAFRAVRDMINQLFPAPTT